VGIQVFTRKFDYNPAKAYSISNNTAANISNAQQSLLTNYNSATTGFTVYAASR
jgi:outer membrane protein insertion porin family